MTEYIKREAAIIAVTGAALPDKTTDGVPIANGKRSVADCVRRIKSIPAEDVRLVKWIPVTERLPNIGEKVITYCKGYGVKENFRSGDGTWWVGFKITHWMPLPEPPKDGEE